MSRSVLIYTRATPHHHTGGMETLAWSLAAEWARLISDVRMVTTAIPGADGPFTEDGVQVVPLAGTAPGKYSGAWWTESSRHWKALPAPPGVVLSVSAGAYSIVADRSPYPNVPFVMQAHGTSWMEIDSKLRAPSLRSLAGAAKNALAMPRDLLRYRDFERIVAVGERVVESLQAPPMRWSAGPDRVRLVHNGVRAEDTRFDPQARAKVRADLGVDEHTVVIGCIGRLHVQKGLDRAVRAAAALRDRGVGDRFAFMIVGDGPDESRLRALARELGVEKRVLFTGPVDRRAVRDRWSAADVALAPTARVEGLPMTVLEALGCGLPCVVTAGSVGARALAPVLRQVDSADPQALATALIEAAAVRGDRRNLLPPEFDLAHCARAYLAVFDEAGAELDG